MPFTIFFLEILFIFIFNQNYYNIFVLHNVNGIDDINKPQISASSAAIGYSVYIMNHDNYIVLPDISIEL